jgi:hypothetical protein
MQQRMKCENQQDFTTALSHLSLITSVLRAGTAASTLNLCSSYIHAFQLLSRKFLSELQALKLEHAATAMATCVNCSASTSVMS